MLANLTKLGIHPTPLQRPRVPEFDREEPRLLTVSRAVSIHEVCTTDYLGRLQGRMTRPHDLEVFGRVV